MSNGNTSRPTDTSNWVTVALLVRPRGIRGEITAISQSGHPERFAQLKSVRLFIADKPGSGAEYQVERVWDHLGTLVFKFAGVDSMNDAELLRGAEVRIPPGERVALEPGEYFQSDLIGCEVRDHESKRVIGRVTGWEEYGGPSLLQVDGGRVLIPFVKAICVDIRPADRVIETLLPEGLEDAVAASSKEDAVAASSKEDAVPALAKKDAVPALAKKDAVSATTKA